MRSPLGAATGMRRRSPAASCPRAVQLQQVVARADQRPLFADGPEPTKLFQGDRIQPREEAHPIMLDNVWPELRKLLPK